MSCVFLFLSLGLPLFPFPFFLVVLPRVLGSRRDGMGSVLVPRLFIAFVEPLLERLEVLRDIGRTDPENLLREHLLVHRVERFRVVGFVPIRFGLVLEIEKGEVVDIEAVFDSRYLIRPFVFAKQLSEFADRHVRIAECHGHDFFKDRKTEFLMGLHDESEFPFSLRTDFTIKDGGIGILSEFFVGVLLVGHDSLPSRRYAVDEKRQEGDQSVFQDRFVFPERTKKKREAFPERFHPDVLECRKGFSQTISGSDRFTETTRKSPEQRPVLREDFRESLVRNRLRGEHEGDEGVFLGTVSERKGLSFDEFCQEGFGMGTVIGRLYAAFEPLLDTLHQFFRLVGEMPLPRVVFPVVEDGTDEAEDRLVFASRISRAFFREGYLRPLADAPVGVVRESRLAGVGIVLREGLEKSHDSSFDHLLGILEDSRETLDGVSYQARIVRDENVSYSLRKTRKEFL